VAKLGRPIEEIGLAAPGFGDVPYLDVVVTHDPGKNTAAVFVMNRDIVNEQELELNWHDLTPTKVLAFETITGPDLKAGNTFADPKKVVPQTLESPKAGSKMTVKLPARSYSVLSVAL
jgi:alpha-N-arabinofuranosidase